MSLKGANRPRLLFFHSEVRPYRVPLFDRLARGNSTKFLFLHETRYADKTPEAKSWNYHYLKPYRIPGYGADACPGVISRLIVERHNYDIAVFSGIFSFATHVGVPIAKLLGKRVILWDETWVAPKNIIARASLLYLRYLVRSADALVASGTRARSFYESLGGKRGKCFIAPNCSEDLRDKIDPKKKDALRKKLGYGDSVVTIGYLGRTVRYKALDTLITSFCEQIRPRYPYVRLLIVGDGPFSDECHKLLDHLGWGQVDWVNGDPSQVEPVDHDAFIHYLSLTDIFVLPGRFVLTDNVPAEAWGLILNEAMSLSKPVISTRSVAGAFDLIENGVNGYLVKEDSAAELSEATGKLLISESLRLKAGIRSREIIDQQFSYEKMYQGFSRAISYCVEEI